MFKRFLRESFGVTVLSLTNTFTLDEGSFSSFQRVWFTKPDFWWFIQRNHSTAINDVDLMSMDITIVRQSVIEYLDLICIDNVWCPSWLHKVCHLLSPPTNKHNILQGCCQSHARVYDQSPSSLSQVTRWGWQLLSPQSWHVSEGGGQEGDDVVGCRQQSQHGCWWWLDQ